MPHTRKRPSVNPRFLIESGSSQQPPSSIKSNKARIPSKLPVDMQIFRLMGNTVPKSTKEYPMMLPDFVSRLISANADEAESSTDAKLRSWKIITELHQFKQQQQQFQQDQPSDIVSHEKPPLHMPESTSPNSLSPFTSSPSLEQRNTQQLIALAQAKVSGVPKKLLNRNTTLTGHALFPQSLMVGGRSISRPNTPGVPVPFVRGMIGNRANSISAAATPATSKPLNLTGYAQLLNSTQSLSSPTAINGNNGSLSQKPLPPTDSFHRSMQLSPSLGNAENSTNNIPNAASNASLNNSNGSETTRIQTSSTAIAFSRSVRLNNGITTTRSNTMIKSVPVAPANSSFTPTRYVDPLCGINSPTSSLLTDLYRRRINEITLFTEQTIRFEQRKANRVAARRSVTGSVVGALVSTSSTATNISGNAPSPLGSPLGKYLQRTMSPIEPSRRSAVDDQQRFSDEDDEDDSDIS